MTGRERVLKNLNFENTSATDLGGMLLKNLKNGILMRSDGGFVFNSIHNILAEIDPKKVIAMYKAAGAE